MNYLIKVGEPVVVSSRAIVDSLDVFCGPRWVPRQPDHLFRNQQGSAFVDVSAETGVDRYRLPALLVSSASSGRRGEPCLLEGNESPSLGNVHVHPALG